MGIPQVIMLVLIGMSLGIAIINDGKETTSSGIISLIATFIHVGLLYWGGFFG